MHHGANINQRAPAMPRGRFAAHHSTYTPLIAYLKDIESFTVGIKLETIAGVNYFLEHGAEVQPAGTTGPREWPWLGSEGFRYLSGQELCQYVSTIDATRQVALCKAT